MNRRGTSSLAAAVCLIAASLSGCDQFQAPTGPSAPVTNAAAARSAAALSQAIVPGIAVRAPDAFYDPPASVPTKPGVLLRSEPLKGVTLPAGLQGWRILYTTTVSDTWPATAVATVFAPLDLPTGPRPVIAWEHGTTGLLQKCMPSLASVPAQGIPALDRIVGEGWVIVATDYAFTETVGPHPYMIGEAEARATLDSVRAARQMRELKLDNRAVAWGHSQGGHSALWTGIVGPRYAPDIKILGVAAIAPAANMKSILAMNPEVDRRLGPYVARSYSWFYPDVRFDEALRPEARVAAHEIVNLCGMLPREDPKRIAALSATFEGGALATATNPALAMRLAQNTANGSIAAPVVIAQGLTDVVVPTAATDDYVAQRCSAGQRLEYWKFEGRDHGGIVQPGTPLDGPLIEWTTARFASEPQASGCAQKSF
jgi:pimeloyl-ACP methyl ester carboxylesterase